MISLDDECESRKRVATVDLGAGGSTQQKEDACCRASRIEMDAFLPFAFGMFWLAEMIS